jgi:ABC-2 type transport system permease protein
LVATVMGLFAFRMLRVEAVFFNTGRPDQLIRWAAEFRLPDWSWIPSSWLVRAIDSMLPGGDSEVFATYSTHLILGALLLLSISCLLSVPILRGTWSRSYGVSRKQIGGITWMCFGQFHFPGLHRPDSAMALKEMKSFARDLSRWSQLVMMIPLIGFYLLNMQMLPFRDQFREIYYLLNLFMIAFIQAAIGARYLFPSISWEGPALWLVRVSPYPVWRLVMLKFLFLTLPLLILTLALTVLSFWILDFGSDSLMTSLPMALVTSLLLSGLAVGFGAVIPRFRYEHHLEISLGPGGVLYMLTALAFCVLYLGLVMEPALTAMGERIWDWGNWSFSKLHPPSWTLCLGWTCFCLVGTGTSLLVGISFLARREEFDR